MEKVKIFDTTLRDGEQTPKVNLNKDDKVMIARQLEKLGVDIIEAGFPVASQGDFEGVKAVAQAVTKPIVCALARCNEKDIDRAAEALVPAKHPRIHVFIATSDVHLEYKLKMSREEVVQRTMEMVAYAKSKVEDIQFSAEDASRTDLDFLCEVYSKAIEAGATTINVPDTVGYIQPDEYTKFIQYIKNHTKGIEKVTISVHCHDDLGLATANAMAGVIAGARQIECTINGIGERAGNTSLEEAVMIMKTRGEHYELDTDINTREIYRTSKLVSALSNIVPSPTKSVIGKNCFLHESGIHQDGVLKNRTTYEIMNSALIGIPMSDGIILGKHSGRHAFKKYLEHNGIDIKDDQLEKAFVDFKDLTTTKKYITVEDITAIATGGKESEHSYQFVSYHSSNTQDGSEMWIRMKLGEKEIVEKGKGNGQVDAAYKAINRIVNQPIEILNYEINAVSGQSDALGEVKVRMKWNDKEINSSGLDMDIIKASILAYINGINRLGISF